MAWFTESSEGIKLALSQLLALSVSWLTDKVPNYWPRTWPFLGCSPSLPSACFSFLLAALGTHVSLSCVGFDGTVTSKIYQTQLPVVILI